MDHFVSRSELQLLGTAALMLSAKYEEIYPPTIDEFVFITANAYQKDELVRMERHLFITMEYRVTFPTSLSLAKCLHAVEDPQPTDVEKHLVLFVLHSTLIAFTHDQYLANSMAAAAVYIARRWCRIPTRDPPQDVKELIEPILTHVAAINTGTRLNAIRNRFAQPKHLRVSSFPIPTVAMFADVLQPPTTAAAAVPVSSAPESSSH